MGFKIFKIFFFFVMETKNFEFSMGEFFRLIESTYKWQFLNVL